MVIGEVLPVAVCPPLEVTVYCVMADPPFDGALNVIVACRSPRVTPVIVGIFGIVAGVTALLAVEAELVPTSLVAVTVKVYATPFVRPVTVIHDSVPVAVNPPIFDITV